MNRKTIQVSLNAALACHKAGKLEEAARMYAQVCRSAPSSFDAWYLAGALAFHRGGHLDQAIDYLTRALRLRPGSVDCQLFLGMALADEGRYAEAEKPLRTALMTHRSFPEAWESLANVFSALGRPTADTVDCLRRALALAPNRMDLRQRIDELMEADVLAAQTAGF